MLDIFHTIQDTNLGVYEVLGLEHGTDRFNLIWRRIDGFMENETVK